MELETYALDMQRAARGLPPVLLADLADPKEQAWRAARMRTKTK